MIGPEGRAASSVGRFLVLSEQQRRITHLVGSVLLSYPDVALLGCLPFLRELVDKLPDVLRMPLSASLNRLAHTPMTATQADYDGVFGPGRESRLCLTSTLAHRSDCQARAIRRFVLAYERSDFEPPVQVPPDHLTVVLELSANGDTGAAGALLAGCTLALERLGDACAAAGSAYTGVIDAVRKTLAPPAHAGKPARSRTPVLTIR